jgi:hypothetical protein
MAQVKLFYDHVGHALTVWFDNPQKEYICEETGRHRAYYPIFLQVPQKIIDNISSHN